MEATLPKTARFIIDSQGRKTDVVIPVDDLDELMEDIYDAAIARSRLDDEKIPWDEALKILRPDGKI